MVVTAIGKLNSQYAVYIQFARIERAPRLDLTYALYSPLVSGYNRFMRFDKFNQEDLLIDGWKLA